MRKLLHSLLAFVAVFLTLSAQAQKGTTVAGSVKTVKTGEAIAAVSVTVKGGSAGTFTDDKGNFKFTTTQKPPFTLVISSIGFDTKEVSFKGGDVSVELMPASTFGQEVTVAASKYSEKVMESPVSIERLNLSAIRNTPATSYYDAITNLKRCRCGNCKFNF